MLARSIQAVNQRFEVLALSIRLNHVKANITPMKVKSLASSSNRKVDKPLESSLVMRPARLSLKKSQCTPIMTNARM